MAYTTSTNMPLKMPTPGTREPAQISLINDNMLTVDAHDHTTGKGVAASRLRSGLDANRPAASAAGQVYFATDTGMFYVDTGTAWVNFLTSGGASTVTGWTLVDPIVRNTISWGAKPSGSLDTVLTRSAAGVIDFTGAAGATKAWMTFRASGSTGSGRVGQPTAPVSSVWLTANADFTGTQWNRDDVARPATHLSLGSSDDAVNGLAMNLSTVRAGANPITFVTRMTMTNTGCASINADDTQTSLNLSNQPTFVWGTGNRVLQLGSSNFVSGNNGANVLNFGAGVYYDGTNNRAALTGWQFQASLNGSQGAFGIYGPNDATITAGQPTTGANLSMVQRWGLDLNGSVTQTTRAGAGYPALSWAHDGTTFQLVRSGSEAISTMLWTNAGALVFQAGNNYVRPETDVSAYLGSAAQRWAAVYTSDVRSGSGNLYLRAGSGASVVFNVPSTYMFTEVDNTAYLGYPSSRWIGGYIVNPMTVGSSLDLKENIAPLDPDACVASVLVTDWISYDYKPHNKAPHGVEDDDPERDAKIEAHDAAYAKSVEETAFSRSQKGYVLNSPDHKVGDLFGLSDRMSRSDGADIGVLGCALQQALQRIAALEAKNA